MELGLIVAAIFVGLVGLVTFGLQGLILLLQASIWIGRGLLAVVLALAWCVIWVFNRKAAMEAWRKPDVRP